MLSAAGRPPSFPGQSCMQWCPVACLTTVTEIQAAFVGPTSCQVVQTDMAEGSFGLARAVSPESLRRTLMAAGIAFIIEVESRQQRASSGLARLVPARLARDLSDRNQGAALRELAWPRGADVLATADLGVKGQHSRSLIQTRKAARFYPPTYSRRCWGCIECATRFGTGPFPPSSIFRYC